MAQHEDTVADSSCLCRKFVPEDKRIDYDQIVKDPKTGKSGWKTLMRAHQDCPEHGLIVTPLDRRKETE